MKKSYQLAGYTLHVIPSKKFKNITMSLKLEGKLTKENVTKRSLLAFMLTGGTENYPSTQALSTCLMTFYFIPMLEMENLMNKLLLLRKKN